MSLHDKARALPARTSAVHASLSSDSLVKQHSQRHHSEDTTPPPDQIIVEVNHFPVRKAKKRPQAPQSSSAAVDENGYTHHQNTSQQVLQKIFKLPSSSLQQRGFSRAAPVGNPARTPSRRPK
jgi:hypothetical protein